MGISPTQSLIVIKKVPVFKDVSVISPNFLYLCTRNRTSIRYDAKRVIIIRKSRGIYGLPTLPELLKVKPEYGSSRHIEVKMVNGEVEMTSQNFDETEQSEFWNDMTNLHKAKIIR